MRLLLILIIIAAIVAFVQSQRHGCKWGDPSWQAWFDCVIGRTVSDTPTPTAAPEPMTPAPETPAPETPNP